MGEIIGALFVAAVIGVIYYVIWLHYYVIKKLFESDKEGE